MLLTLLGVSLLTWSMVHLAPGDSAEIYARQFAESGRPTQEEIDLARVSLGLDATPVVQYARWLQRIVRGDLGRSFSSGEPIVSELGRRLPATVELALVATALSFVAGVSLGAWAAATRRRSVDAAIRLVAISGGAVPAFLLALLAIWVFAVRLDWLPSVGRDGLFSAGLVLPAGVLALGQLGATARLARSTTADALSADHIWAARARGLPEARVVRAHAIRNALAPVLTFTAGSLGGLLGGAVVVESVFAWPGMGTYVVDAVRAQDYPAIQAGVLVGAAVYVLIALVLDVVYRALDPRIGR